MPLHIVKQGECFTTIAERYGFGNRRYDSRFIRGEIALNSPQYFYGYPFEGKPRAFYVSYNTSF